MNPRGLTGSITGHHGSILQLHLFLLLLSGHASAQSTDGDSDMSGESYRFDPNMVILMIVLISVFFTLGFFSICLRTWLERFIGMNNAHSVGAGGNRLSLNRPRAPGIDASVIETFPTFRYSTVKMLMISKEALEQWRRQRIILLGLITYTNFLNFVGFNGPHLVLCGSATALECPICLNEFEDDETLLLIPKCCHVFHPDCIYAWLQSHATCPLCRANLVPVPGESFFSIDIPGLADDTLRSESTGDRNTGFVPPDARLIDSVALTCNDQSMPRRSIFTGWSVARIFTTGQHEGNLDRFTLRLPQDIHNKLVDPSFSKCHVTFPQMMSSAQGYRTGS
ncbi:hypothetical protein Bca101_049284 [Brassica carinata]